jgi:VCBS repeat-containing protein
LLLTLSVLVLAAARASANEPPVLVNLELLSVSEGSSANPITTTDLLVTDLEQGAASLTYTVHTAPANGTLSPASGFTQAQIDAGSLSYSHDGSETTSDFFIFSVSDGAGGTLGPLPFAISVTPVNDAPVLETLVPLVLSEGASAPITAGLLEVTDPDNTPAQITFTLGVTGVVNGALHLDATPLTTGSTFTQEDINEGRVSYQHDGGETTSDSFAFTVSDGAGGSLGNTIFNISVVPVNDDPVVDTLESLTVAEGSSATTITTAHLLITDPEQSAASLTFTVEISPASGTLSLGTFTQAQIVDGLLSYSHDGSETTSDSFVFSVSDGAGGSLGNTIFDIIVTPMNDDPVLATLEPLVVAEGSFSTPITTAELLVTDAEQPAGSLTYTVAISPTSGTLSLGTFTQAQIDAASVTYSHDGSETTSDSFVFTVSDGVGGSLGSTIFDITVTPVNDDPVLNTLGSLALSEGASAVIPTGLLEVTDPEQGPAHLTYTVQTPPANGTLSPASAFTQAQIDAGLLSYSHDGSETNSDTFVFSVSDGVGGSLGSTIFNITVTPVNDDPVLATLEPLVVAEGSPSTPITTAELLVTDADQPAGSLTYTVQTSPANGTLSPASAFTQAQIDAASVTYSHDGSETTSDFFVFTVSDGAGGSLGSTLFDITVTPVNDDPVLNTLGSLALSEGASAPITAGLLEATDPEQIPAHLTYTVHTSPVNGTLSPASAFTQAQIDAGLLSYSHDGSETTSDSFVFSVSDGVGGSIGSTVFDITVTPLNDDPVLETLESLVVPEGTSVPLTPAVLRVTDAEQGAANLVFTVQIAPINGMLSHAAFTQAQIDAGSVSYTHDGSQTTSDFFVFSVTDGAGGSIGNTIFDIDITAPSPPAVPATSRMGLAVLAASILLMGLRIGSSPARSNRDRALQPRSRSG